MESVFFNEQDVNKILLKKNQSNLIIYEKLYVPEMGAMALTVMEINCFTKIYFCFLKVITAIFNSLKIRKI